MFLLFTYSPCIDRQRDANEGLGVVGEGGGASAGNGKDREGKSKFEEGFGEGRGGIWGGERGRNPCPELTLTLNPKFSDSF